MYVNNEIGSIQDINTIGVACKEKNIPFHVDATQAVGKLSIDMEKDNIDYLVFSGHKFHAFKGVGAIVCRNKSCLNDLTPLMFGGHQQFGLRPGTEDVERIFHMATVLNSEYQSIIEHQQLSYNFNLLLSNLFEEECFKNNINIIINSNDFRIPVFSISFKGLSGDFLVSELNNLGIYISTGSACTSGELEPSYVLQAIGVSDDYINGTIRISFDPYDDNLENKLKTVVNKIINLVK
jgi:cysteine desulfurase